MNLETVQIVIVAALSISTILVTIIGIQLILLLKTVHTVIRRAENLVNGVGNFATTLSNSFADMDHIVQGVRLVTGLVSKFTKSRKSHERK